jgi:TldD protein
LTENRLPHPDPVDLFAGRHGLDGALLGRVLSTVLGGDVDDGDVFCEVREREILELEEGLVKSATREVVRGVGVRAIAGARTGYAHTSDTSAAALLDAARTARAVARSAGSAAPVAVRPAPPGASLYPVPEAEAALAAPLERKLGLLHAVDARCRAADPRVTQVMASLASEQRVVLVLTADGRLVGDVRPLTTLAVTCIVEGAGGPGGAGARGGRQRGFAGGGGRVGFAALVVDDRHLALADEAVRRAVVNLDAVPAPAGELVVVLGPGWPGILLHEAVGHGLEGDFNRKGTSAFAGRIGQRVASERCTVVDDGTIADRRGSLNVDDEGTPTARNVLIENGVLRGYLQDRLNGRLMGTGSTGNGRRQDFGHVPLPRMTNTFLLPGDEAPEDILRSVRRGLYAVGFGGGQVDITSGKFVFSATEAYLVEDGRVTAPVRDATLIGSGPDVLTKVTRVGADAALDPGIGTCGKEGQSVPVGVGLPTLRVDGITVGGTG